MCGLADAGHAENAPLTAAEDAVVVPLACSLVGHEGAIELAGSSRAARLQGAGRTMERYYCNYGPNPHHVDLLRSHGLRFPGMDDAGEVRIAELPAHPFFLATLFQPELHGDGTRPHP